MPAVTAAINVEQEQVEERKPCIIFLNPVKAREFVVNCVMVMAHHFTRLYHRDSEFHCSSAKVPRRGLQSPIS